MSRCTHSTVANPVKLLDSCIAELERGLRGRAGCGHGNADHGLPVSRTCVGIEGFALSNTPGTTVQLYAYIRGANIEATAVRVCTDPCVPSFASSHRAGTEVRAPACQSRQHRHSRSHSPPATGTVLNLVAESWRRTGTTPPLQCRP